MANRRPATRALDSSREKPHFRSLTEAWEAERTEWVTLTGIRRLIDKRELVNGTSMNALTGV